LVEAYGGGVFRGGGAVTGGGYDVPKTK